MPLSNRQRNLGVLGLGLGLTALILFSGCGSDNPLGRRAISGEVKLNGAPLQRGSIEFHPLAPGGAQSGGAIVAGRYSIPESQGLPVGKYRVMIYATEEPPPLPPDHMPGEDVAEPKSLIPPEWNRDSTETIEVTSDGRLKFDFDIKTST